MDFPQPPDFLQLLAALTRELNARQVPFMLIGGQAVLLHGRPRLTDDIDVTLGVGPTALPVVLAACRALGLEPLPEDLEAFVRDTFVLPARDPRTGIRLDFIFSTTAYERQAIARAERVELRGIPVPFATAEDLIVHKLFAGRPRDVEDAAGVVRRKGPTLDWAYLERWVGEFAAVPGREDLPHRLAQLRASAGLA
jgi:predicted nucleotidyltransferase